MCRPVYLRFRQHFKDKHVWTLWKRVFFWTSDASPLQTIFCSSWSRKTFCVSLFPEWVIKEVSIQGPPGAQVRRPAVQCCTKSQKKWIINLNHKLKTIWFDLYDLKSQIKFIWFINPNHKSQITLFFLYNKEAGTKQCLLSSMLWKIKMLYKNITGF